MFCNQKLKDAYNNLKEGDAEQQRLYKHITNAINDLDKNLTSGIPVQKRLIPKDYIKKYKINNLWKYDLPGAWRLIYTITGNKIKIVSIILEWMTHKEYERKFKY